MINRLPFFFLIFSLLQASLHAAAPQNLTGKIRVSYGDEHNWPDYGVEYHYYKTDSVFVFLDLGERSENSYSWNSDSGRLTDYGFSEYFDYTYTSTTRGIYVADGGSTGTFVTYDSSWDLDFNGIPDGEQIDAGTLPSYTHKQLGSAALGTSNFWLSNEGSIIDISLTFSEQQIDVISSGSSPWCIANALWVTTAGEINSLSWDEDWRVDVTMVNSVNVSDGGTRVDSDGNIDAINQAVMWLDILTTAASPDDSFGFGITLQDHNGVKRILSESPIDDTEYAVPYSPVEVHMRLSYDATAAELSSSYSYDGNQYTTLTSFSVATLPTYVNRYPLAVALGAESDNVQISSGENTFKNFVVISGNDSDGDGLLDSVETNTGVYLSESNAGTDPNNADSSGDGLSDGYVVSAGFDPNTDYSALLSAGAMNARGYYSSAQMVDARAGSVGIVRDGTTANLELQIQRSVDLETWTAHEGDRITVPMDMTGDQQFFRFAMPE